MKKIIFVCFIALMLCLGVSANAKETVFVCDGGIELSGTINSARGGDIVTVMVFKESVPWKNESYWVNADNSNIVYGKETTLDEQRGYNFKFYLNNNGVYTAFIGSEEFDEVKEETIVYVNKTNNDSALSRLSLATDETVLATVLVDYKDDIGLFDGYYNDINYTEVAKILFPYVKQNNLDYESAIRVIDKACVAWQISSETITEIESVKDYLHMDETEKNFYREEYSKDICSILNKNTINTIESFEKTLREAIILCTVNKNDGLGDVREILNCYADEYGIEKAKLTTDVCSALVEKSNTIPFDDISDIVLYVNNFVLPPQNTGGSGGGSNNTTAGNHPLSGVKMPVYENTDNQHGEVSVFSDLDNVEWANEAIKELYYKGIINGTSDNEFSPNKNVAREEFAKMLAKAFKLDLVSEEQCFDDVSPRDWCYDYVNSLYLAGVVNGMDNRVFGKGEDVTRQDICVMICRIIDVVQGTVNHSKEKMDFIDEALISSYAKDSVLKMQVAGIVSGYEDGSFNPDGKATRAEAAKMIYETLLKVKY